MRDLHFGLALPNYGPALDAKRLARAAVAAEESQFDSAWTTDHLMVPPEHAAIYGTIAEALVSLGYVTAFTSKLELGVSALIVPMRDPLVALKQITTLDFLSGGRVVMSVAAGWMEREFEILGKPFEGKGKVLDQWIETAESVFRSMPGEVPTGGFMAPPLEQAGGPEIWVAGGSEITLRRAARTGVWHPSGLAPDVLRSMAARFRERRPDGRVVLRLGVFLEDEPVPGGREVNGRHTIAGPLEWLAEELLAYVDAGCDGFVVDLDHEDPALEERVRTFGNRVIPELRRGR